MAMDQAHRLRELARRGASGARSAPAHVGTMPLVVVSGGSGGVGASTIALNLAAALQRNGLRSLLIEADLDRGGLLGPADCGGSIADCLSGERSLRDTCRLGPDGMLVVPGAWAPREMADCTALAQQRFLAELQRPMPQVDIAIADLGSSRNSFVRRFWQVASMVIVVAAEGPESVMNAYAAIKVLHAGDTSIPVYTLLNLADAGGQANRIHERIGQTCKRFLGLRTSILGELPRLKTLTGHHARTAFNELADLLARDLGLRQPDGSNRHHRRRALVVGSVGVT